MKISIIAAVSENGIIGINNQLPWHLPSDLKYFKEKTWGHTVITGRRNYESIPPAYRPLKGRKNIVITRQSNYQAPGSRVTHSLEEAIRMANSELSTERNLEIFIIGGGEIYRQAIPITEVLYITRIHVTIDGDVSFPEFSKTEWKCIQNLPNIPLKEEKYKSSFELWVRK